MWPVQHFYDVEKWHACAAVHQRISAAQRAAVGFISNMFSVVSPFIYIQYSVSILMRARETKHTNVPPT